MTSSQPRRVPQRTRSDPQPGRGALARSGAIIGIVTALAALGAAQIVAAVLAAPASAPVDAVGAVSINHTPAAVKNWAISEFGSNDKSVLVWGIRGVLIVCAVVIGVLALRRLWLGMAGLAVFALVGIAAALAQPGASASYAFPSLVGAGAGALALRYFCRLGSRELTRTRASWPPTAAAPGQSSPPRQSVSRGPGDTPGLGSELPSAGGASGGRRLRGPGQRTGVAAGRPRTRLGRRQPGPAPVPGCQRGGRNGLTRRLRRRLVAG